MREIKFRAWDTENKEMLEVENLYFNEMNGQVEIKTRIYSDYFNEEEMILMQYTGLKDKNGKEIYEGDIVKSILILDNGIKLRTNIDVVEWKKEECCFMLTNDIRHFHNNLEMEVIGNIFENGDLLKEE